MLAAGYFRSGPAHSDNSTCSLKSWKAAEVLKSDRAYGDKFLYKLFLLCSQDESWYPPGGIQAGDWRSACGMVVYVVMMYLECMVVYIKILLFPASVVPLVSYARFVYIL